MRCRVVLVLAAVGLVPALRADPPLLAVRGTGPSETARSSAPPLNQKHRTAAKPVHARRPLAAEDLYRLEANQSPVLAPDGRRLVYVRKWIDPESKRDRHALWVVEAPGRARPLEEDEADGRAPVFSPDGKWIAFLSTRHRPEGWKQTLPAPPQSDPATDLWLLPTSGGPAVPLAGRDRPYGRVFDDGFYGHIAFSPDGSRLAFVAEDGKDPRSPEEVAAGVRVVRPDGGEGYTGYTAAQVWVAQLRSGPGEYAASQIERLTTDDAWYGDPHWSPDGRTIVVHANRTADRAAVRWIINKDFDLWGIDLRTHQLTRLTTGPGPEVSPRFSPDGKHIVCLSVPRKGSHRDVFNLALVTLSQDGPHTRVVFDYHAPGGAGKAPPFPAFPLPEECWAGNSGLVYTAEVGTRTPSVYLDLNTGAAEEFSSRKGKPASGPALLDRLAQQQRLRPPAGNAFLRERLLASSKVIRWASTDDLEIEGILTLPPPTVATPPYKLLLYPHGGPHSRSALGFDFTVQLFASCGYAVLQPNYRGSHGYGQRFIDADRFDFGGGDVRDILAGIDELIKQRLVDKGQQFVYGSSYGGFLTCWLVSHTNRFRAAVAQNAVTDMQAMWGLSDIQSWVEWEVGDPFRQAAVLRKHSPLTYAPRVQTPTLLLHARDDRRVPLANGKMFYQALRARGVPTEMVIYPGEGHVIRQPRHREDVLRRVLAWFARSAGS